MATVELEREATEILRGAYGPNALLREGQLEALAAILEPGARRLLVQATGWGKSVVYFLAARLLRNQHRGRLLVVSPLIALMRNQVEFAARFGLSAAAVHSENQGDWPHIEARLKSGGVDALFVSPERLHAPEFRTRILPAFLAHTALTVIDEAHCISEWGHDFRPEYRSILRQLNDLPKNAAILAATATATVRVEEDLRRLFGPFLDIQRGRLVRPSLRLVSVPLESTAERLAWLAHYLPKMPGSGIVYALTVFEVKEVARWLRSRGIEAEPYFAELGAERRIELESAFSSNQIKALVATTALGMGYDKSDVGFVVHFQMPVSLISYYQQIGRAGRAADRAYAVLLGTGVEEGAVLESFVNAARPPDAVFEAIVDSLRRGPKSFAELCHSVAAAPSMIRNVLDILASAEAAYETGGRYHADATAAAKEIRHGSEIRELRRSEFRQMREYVESGRCRMQSVAEALGDIKPSPCGICDRCKPVPAPHLSHEEVELAATFLKGETKILVPRTRLPIAIPGRKATLNDKEMCEPGIVLGIYGDGNWGQAVRDGKYRHRAYPRTLLEAALAAVRDAGRRFSGIAWIPTSDTSSPLPTFVHSLAEELGVPAKAVVTRRRPGPPQKSMSAAREQFLNIWDAFEVTGPVHGEWLLVDDIVDSGWTLTIVGLRLRQAGASMVIPLALAAASTTRVRFADEGAEI